MSEFETLCTTASMSGGLPAKDAPQAGLVEKIARDWYGKDIHTDWIVKHGCRTLLKKGSSDVLGILGFAESGCVMVDGFSLNTASVFIGDDISFSFEIEANKSAKIRLEYEIDYVKASGRRNRKIFKISELTFKDNGKNITQKTFYYTYCKWRRTGYAGL